MLFRVLALCLGLAAFAMLNGALVAEDKDSAIEGTVVSAADGKLTIDSDGKEKTLAVGAKAKISCNGKKCDLGELKKGTKVKVTTKKGDEKTALRIVGKTA